MSQPVGREPKHYFLNEKHELSPVEKTGGGRLVPFVGVNWKQKGRALSQSISSVRERVAKSSDPLREEHLFAIAKPSPIVRKSSTSKAAIKGYTESEVSFAGNYGRVFERLGLDLIQIASDGSALIHAEPWVFETLEARAETLDALGLREQSRWVAIENFDVVPVQMRLDVEWFELARDEKRVDTVIELQPVLARREVDAVGRTIVDQLLDGRVERLTGIGSDFSGRYWLRGYLSPGSIRKIARSLFSVQSIHSPLYSIAAAKRSSSPSISRASSSTLVSLDPLSLPCVAVVDVGVADDHKRLSPYRRGKYVSPQGLANPTSDHGAFVASRVVFGHSSLPGDFEKLAGECSYYDVCVGDYPTPQRPNPIDDKAVVPSMQGVRNAATDVRVFNLSFSDVKPLEACSDVERNERLALLSDLDNFVVGNDAVVVVAAGNSPPGLLPASPYPKNFTDARWRTGAWARGMNTLVCGSFVDRVAANGIVQTVGWPSPFCRVGPGMCTAPVPSFGEPGGNCDMNWRWAGGLGVIGYSGAGLIEDRCGTSMAAPLLARKAARTLDELQHYCPTGTQPFAVLARSFLAITAKLPIVRPGAEELTAVTLGRGQPDPSILHSPNTRSAMMFWQGHIPSHEEKIRVQIPVPRDWLRSASEPRLRFVACWDPPVNHTAGDTWVCRCIKPVLHLAPDEAHVAAPQGGHPLYPLVDRIYKLNRFASDNRASADGLWVVELKYEECAPYPIGLQFDPRQRVAFVAELFDESPNPVDPHPAVQAIPSAAAMTQLSTFANSLHSSVLVRARP